MFTAELCHSRSRSRRQSPRSLLDARDLTGQGFEPELVPAQAKLAHDAPPPPRLRAPVFDRGRPGVLAERVQLQLRLVADLRGEVLVARDIQVRAAEDLVGVHAVAGLDVAEHTDVGHGGGKGKEQRVELY